jgi:ribosomal protein L37AE/L43A
MQKVVVSCRKEDIRRIRISCRCGNLFIVEIPQQVARALNLHPCPGCGAGFVITQQADGKWQIDRCTETVDQMTIEPDTAAKKEFK